MQRPKFDLALSYPQWQGSGRSTNLRRGAEAAAEICGQYAPLMHVPLAGDGEAAGGINRWTAIFDQFRSAQSILSEAKPQRILTAGGDCAVDIAAVIDYLHRQGQYPDLTVIWVDAHLDANTPDTSPSGNFLRYAGGSNHGFGSDRVAGLIAREAVDPIAIPVRLRTRWR